MFRGCRESSRFGCRNRSGTSSANFRSVHTSGSGRWTAQHKVAWGSAWRLVQRLVEMHGETATASSAAGLGSEFVVRLPMMLTNDLTHCRRLSRKRSR